MTYAGGAEAEQYRRGSISSATSADGKTSRRRCGTWWGKARGWKEGRCRHVQIFELFSMEKCDQAVMDFLAATHVAKFPPKQPEERG
jgi:hypothetical protein